MSFLVRATRLLTTASVLFDGGRSKLVIYRRCNAGTLRLRYDNDGARWHCYSYKFRGEKYSFFIQSSSSTLFWGVTFHNGPIAQRDVWLLFAGNGLHRLHRVFIGSTHRHRHYCLPDKWDIGLGRSGPHSTHFCLPHCIRTNKSCLSKHYWSLLYLSNSIRQNKYWFLFFGKQIHLVLVIFFVLLFWVGCITKCISPLVAQGNWEDEIYR